MLQQMKKPVTLLSAILMCLTMFTGIVLPRIAETATAVADPYAAVAGHVTQLTVTDGKVTPAGGSAMDVPEEYLGLEIYEPGYFECRCKLQQLALRVRVVRTAKISNNSHRAVRPSVNTSKRS